MLLTLLQEGPPVNGVEGIAEIGLEKHCRAVVPVSLAPLARRLQGHLGAEWVGHADLERKEKRFCLFLVLSAQALADQAA